MNRLATALAITIITTTGAWALEPSGIYTYKERGYSGEMTIDRVNAYEASWKIKIFTVHPSSAHTCEVEGVIDNMVSDEKTIDAVYVSTDEAPGKFTVSFTNMGAAVEVSDNAGFCGMNGYFGGKWARNASKGKPKKVKK